MFDLIPFEHKNKDFFSYFDDMERAFFGGNVDIAPCKTDIVDEGSRYVLKADLPGFQKEDIHLDIEGDRLTISAEHSEEQKSEDDKNHYIRRERRYGSMSRSFDISSIDAEHITAKFEDGVLELNLPKKQATGPTNHRIEIE